MICLDTNVIYHFLSETELTSTSEKVIRRQDSPGIKIWC